MTKLFNVFVRFVKMLKTSNKDRALDQRGRILHSWKEIAEYLKCDRKTCARWEGQFGLPVRRLDSKPRRSRVYAFCAELDDWRATRGRAAVSATPVPSHRRVPKLAVAASVLALLTPAAWLVYKTAFPRHIPLVAVLPLENSPITPSDDYLSLGFTKQIIRRLEAKGGAKVIAVPLSFFGSRGAAEFRSGAEEIDYSVEGKIRMTDEKTSIEIVVRDLRNDRVLWSHPYEAESGRVSDCLDEIVADIRRAVSLSEAPEESSPPSSDGEALDSYFKGDFVLSRILSKSNDPWSLYYQGKYYSGRGEEKDNEFAARLFEQALFLDPNFGPAYLGLAQCYANDLNFGWRFDPNWLEKADEFVEKGRALSPDLPQVYALKIELLLIREKLYGGDSNSLCFSLGQEGLARHMLDGPLNSIVGYVYLRRFERKGDEDDFEKAIYYKRIAYWIDPFAVGNVVLAELLMLKKDFDGAIDICEDLRRNLESSQVEHRLGQILYYMGKLDRSEAVFKALESKADVGLAAQCYLGMIAAAKNDMDRAARIARQIEILRPKSNPTYSVELRLASIYAGLGETAKAREALRLFFTSDLLKSAPFLYKKYLALDKNLDAIRSEIIMPF
jgi:TolB-like protein